MKIKIKSVFSFLLFCELLEKEGIAVREIKY